MLILEIGDLYFMKRCFDYIALLVGALAIIFNLVIETEYGMYWAFLASLFEIVYLFYVIYLLFCRPKFDWYLSHGGLLFKLVVFVLLVPSILTSILFLFSDCPPAKLVDKDGDAKTNLGETLSQRSVDTIPNLFNIKQQNIPAVTKLKVTDTGMVRESVNLGNDVAPKLFWTVYYHFIDPGNQHMANGNCGRGIVAIISILGVFFLNGFLVSFIVGWIDRRKEKYLKGEVRYNFFLRIKKHYVIIGGGDVVAGIVKQIIVEGNYVLIQTSRDVESFRRELFSILTEAQQKKVIIYYGNRNSFADISDLQLQRAKEVYILGEDIRTDDIESYHDTMNMKCLSLISNCFEKTYKSKVIELINNVTQKTKIKIKNAGENKKKILKCIKHFLEQKHDILKLSCRVMFEYQTSFNIFQVTDIDDKKIRFLPFNYYEMWAQRVLVCQELENTTNCKYLPLEGFEGIKSNEDKFVHLVVVGMSRMGLAMAIEAAHLAHYPNFITNKRRTRITFIDSSMWQEKNFFMGRFKEMFSLACYRDITNATERIYNDLETYPWKNPLEDASCRSPYYNADYLGKDFIDIEWEFISGSMEEPNIQQYFVDAASNVDAKLTIAICLPENSRAIAAATYMPDIVYKSDSTLQILVYQRFNDELLKQINFRNERYKNKLKAFGMAHDCYDTSLVSIADYISKEVNNVYEKFNETRIREIINSYNKELTETDLSELSPSYAQIPSDKIPNLRETIKNSWTQWFNENIEYDGEWEKRKNKKYLEIKEQIETTVKVYEIIDNYKISGELNDNDICELSQDYEKVTCEESKQMLRENIIKILIEWFNNDTCKQNVNELKSNIDNKIKSVIKNSDSAHEPEKIGKSKAAKMWSNTYNIHTMWTKFRCFNVSPIEKEENFDETIMSELGQMEHNRWIVEQLLLRFRPLTKGEQEITKITGKYSPSVEKGILKNKFAHLDICSNKVLNKVDYNISKLDIELIKVLPKAYREYTKTYIKK